MDVLAAMQGNADGHGKGLTTYPPQYDEQGELLPDGPDAEQRQAHADCLALEATGQVTRYIDHEHATTGIKHVMWMPAST